MALYSKACQNERTERESANAKNELGMLLINSTMIFITEVTLALFLKKNYNKENIKEFITLKSRINEISPL